MNEISLHILDMLQNSIAAKATSAAVCLRVEAGGGFEPGGIICRGNRAGSEMLVLTVRDNGKGMDEGLLRCAADPFVTGRTSRRVGLGLPLLKDSAEMAAGSFNVVSEPGKGTEVRASFEIEHIDRIPLGDFSGTIAAIITAYPDFDLEITMACGQKLFEMSTGEIKNRLGTVPIDMPEVVQWIKEYLDDAVTEIFGGVLNEVNNRNRGNKGKSP
jgi:hypothetical protein